MNDQTKSAFASRREAQAAGWYSRRHRTRESRELAILDNNERRAAAHASAPRQVWDIARHAWKKVPR